MQNKLEFLLERVSKQNPQANIKKIRAAYECAVAAGLAKRCEIQLAYAIGVAEPVSIMVETFGTGIVDDSVIEQAVEHVFDLRPAAIIEQLDLRKPIYKQLAAYGHMGREELGVKWENRDKAEALKAYINK